MSSSESRAEVTESLSGARLREESDKRAAEQRAHIEDGRGSKESGWGAHVSKFLTHIVDQLF